MSFLTLQTVEGIVGSTDFCTPEGQSSWKNKMEKFVGLGHTYSSVNTVTGEKCYMVDEALYKDILLAVATRKQNEQLLAAASEKFEQHIEQIEVSNNRVLQREKDAIEQMAQRMNNNYLLIQDEHKTRIRNVVMDIRALKESITVSAEHNVNSREMQQLRFELAQYESVIPIYRSRIKYAEDLKKKLFEEKQEFTRNIEHLKSRLNKAESLVLSMGTPEAIRSRGTSRRQADKKEVSEQSSSSEEDDDQDQSSSSSSEDDHDEDGAQERAAQNTEMSIDFSISPTDSGETNKETGAPLPATRPSFREVLDSSRERPSRDVTMDGPTGTEITPAHQRLITLTPLSNKKDDSGNKKTRSSMAHSNDQEQPASKKSPQNAEPPTVQNARDHVAAHRMGNQEKEKEVQEQVRRSCQNVQWTKGPLPTNMGHSFYDTRQAGTEPPESLVAASRNMVLRWKRALGQAYFLITRNSGGSVMSLEHAHRTFKAVTLKKTCLSRAGSPGHVRSIRPCMII